MAQVEVTATEDALAAGVQAALDRGEIGVQVAVWGPDGLLAEAWGGTTDTGRGRPVDADTVFPVYSVTKAITATALHVQVARGLLGHEVILPLARGCRANTAGRSRIL